MTLIGLAADLTQILPKRERAVLYWQAAPPTGRVHRPIPARGVARKPRPRRHSQARMRLQDTQRARPRRLPSVTATAEPSGHPTLPAQQPAASQPCSPVPVPAPVPVTVPHPRSAMWRLQQKVPQPPGGPLLQRPAQPASEFFFQPVRWGV